MKRGFFKSRLDRSEQTYQKGSCEAYLEPCREQVRALLSFNLSKSSIFVKALSATNRLANFSSFLNLSCVSDVSIVSGSILLSSSCIDGSCVAVLYSISLVDLSFSSTHPLSVHFIIVCWAPCKHLHKWEKIFLLHQVIPQLYFLLSCSQVFTKWRHCLHHHFVPLFFDIQFLFYKFHFSFLTSLWKFLCSVTQNVETECVTMYTFLLNFICFLRFCCFNFTHYCFHVSNW